MKKTGSTPANDDQPTQPRRRLRRRAAIALGVGLAIVAPSAIASYTSNSQFAADGVTASVQGVPANGEILDGEGMWPGYKYDVAVSVHNPYPVPVRITDSDIVLFESSHTRLLDFLSDTHNPAEQVGRVIQPNETVTFNYTDAVRYGGEADDASQGKDVRTRWFISYEVVPGNE